MTHKLVFGDKEKIAQVKRDEARGGFVDELLALFEKYYQLTPKEFATLIVYVADTYYEDSDIMDIHKFIDTMRREMKKL